MFARKNSYSRKIVYFGCWCFFYAQNFFVKKKKKKDKNGIDMIVTITSFAILLMCIPINPPIENLFSHVYVHDKSAGFFLHNYLSKSVRIHFHLCFLLSGFICTHLYECSNIKSIDILFVEDTAT